MRPLSLHDTAMLAKYGLAYQTRSRCAWIRLRDSTILGMTTHDDHLTIDMADISDVPVLYRADLGFMPSQIELTEGFSPDNCEITGPITTAITAAHVMGGRYRGAEVRIFDVDWTQAVPTQIPLLRGFIAETRLEERTFTFEVRNELAKLNETYGDILTPYCKADFGDHVLCFFDLQPVPGIITAMADRKHMTVSFAGSYADDFFNFGNFEFVTGELAGTDPIEIFDWESTGDLELYADPVIVPTIGDEVNLYQGCPKLWQACRDFGQILNFRGHKSVPGTDQVMRFSAIPPDE